MAIRWRQKKQKMSAVPPAATMLGNKPCEVPFQLRIESDKLKNGKVVYRFRVGTPVPIVMKITNTTSDRQIFKVKVTENDVFRIQPVVGTVGVGEVATTTVTFKADNREKAIPNRHFIAFYHARLKTTKTAKEAWASGVRAEGVARILVGFEEEKD